MLTKILFALSFICWTCDSCQIARQKPVTPKRLDCTGFLVSSESDECWAQFHDDMDNLETDIESFEWYTENLKENSGNLDDEMEEYTDKLMEQLDNENDMEHRRYMRKLLDKSDQLEKVIKYYKEKLMKGSHKQFSEAGNSKRGPIITFNGGFLIHSDLPTSIVDTNGDVKYVWSLSGRLDEFNYRVNGHEIEFQLTIGGKKKQTHIQVPPNVNMDHIKIEILSDVIQIRGLGASAGQDQNGFMNHLWKFVPRYFTRN